METTYLKNKIVTPLLNLLNHGLTPEKLALTVSVGFILAVFPVLGSTTILCMVCACIFRLNHAAIQIVNYAVYPLWAILLLAFYKIGGVIFQSSAENLSIEKIVFLFRTDILEFIKSFGMATLHAIAAWLLICPFVAAFLYFVTLPIFRKYSES